MALNRKSRIKDPVGDRVLTAVTTAILILIIIIVGYPVLYVISCSFSSAKAIGAGKVLLLPVDVTLAGYEFVFQYEQIWIGYRNTIFYTICGVSITLFMDIMCAYPLSRPYFQGRGWYTAYLMATTIIGAGLIPTYIVKSSLGMVNTVWAVILAGAISVHNVIILRTAFRSSIPGELFDAAEIDGANDFQCLVKIAIPLAKATLSVITLYSIVGCWNEYFNAMIYLRDKNLFPLTLVLRTILTAGQQLDMSGVSANMQNIVSEGTEQIKYCLIIVSTVPVLVAYAVVQKYFKKGVMIGSVKG